MTETSTSARTAARHADWLLSADERGNPDTCLDGRRHGSAWSDGNAVTPLIHGKTYFDELRRALDDTTAGDLVMFTDWRGDPDEKLDDGTEVDDALCSAASRGVVVKGLVWRSHLDVWRFSSEENRRLGDKIENAGGECLLDMRVRPNGSHHQKMVVIRYRDRPERDIAFVGGIDLCHSRRDDARHRGDVQSQPMPAIYGKRPPWHDIQAAIRGPAVGDVEATFRERWSDPAALSHNPIRLVTSLVERDDLTADPIPDQTTDPRPAGDHVVQVLRTYPYRLRGYPFARRGERSIARAYTKAIGQARRLIYLEDQYLWSTPIAAVFAAALRREPELRMIAVIPLHPDTEGLTAQAEVIGRARALRSLRAAGGARFEIYGLESPSGVPVYVHAKACVMDDVWTIIGSDNLNIRSWTHDSELSCAVMDGDGGTEFGRGLRLRLHREHLDRGDGDDADLVSPEGVFDAYRDSAARLDAWHERPDGPRPPGRLRTYVLPTVTGWRVPLARAMYRAICDPDGRPRDLRRARTF